MPIQNVVEAYGNNLIGKHIKGGGGQGGGHIIENAAGTDLDQQNILQFEGTLQATNDATNGKTKVSNAAEVMEWSDWNAMSVAEREAYAVGKEIDIINFPSADGIIKADLLTELWTNPDPTASFAAQNIMLENDDYDFLVWIGRYSTSNSYGISLKIQKGQNVMLSVVADNGNRVVRTASYVSDTSYSVDGGNFNGNADNSFGIPIAVYGIKQKISISLSAIAMDVSTSADKCMLEDGETSVEDVITAHAISSEVSVTHEYTAPSDGYVTFINNNGSGVFIISVNGYNLKQIYVSSGNSFQADSLFVKKDMIIDFDISNFSGQYYLVFRPIS